MVTWSIGRNSRCILDAKVQARACTGTAYATAAATTMIVRKVAVRAAAVIENHMMLISPVLADRRLAR